MDAITDPTKSRASLPRTTSASPGTRVLADAVEACERFPLQELDLARTFMACLCRSALLKLAGAQRAEYEDILVLTGQATAFAYHHRRHHPMQVTPDEPGVVEERISRATGFAWQTLDHEGGGENAWRAIRGAIDGGKAVHGVWIDDLIFCGYDDPGIVEERRLLVGGGWDAPAWWTWDRFDKWAAEFGVLGCVGDPVPIAPRIETIRDVVGAIVRGAEADPRANVQYLRHARYGLEGIRAFAEDIATVARTPDHWHACWLGGHCVYRQISGRAAAARFLQASSSETPPAAAQALTEAARHYERAAHAWGDWGRYLGYESGCTDAEEIRLLWMQTANRVHGAQAVQRALDSETDACRHLKRALALLQA